LRRRRAKNRLINKVGTEIMGGILLRFF
jgi:hypothetical protein